MMTLERDNTGLFQPAKLARATEILRAAVIAEQIETAQRAAVQAFNQAFQPAVELLWPVDEAVARDLGDLADLQSRPDIAEQFREAWQ